VLAVTHTVTKVSGRTKNYYERLGYELPKHFCTVHKEYRAIRGAEFLVRVSDLPVNSECTVHYICDVCGELHATSYKSLNQSKNSDGKHTCHKCWLATHKGEAHPRYREDLPKEERKSRRYNLKNRAWRLEVFNRDNFTCLKCSKRGGTINAHHIEPYAKNTRLRYTTANGATLCVRCHRQYHKSFRGQCNKGTFESYIMRIK
jgi:5-methylcytosine-specific restriction endonuclease McrA